MYADNDPNAPKCYTYKVSKKVLEEEAKNDAMMSIRWRPESIELLTDTTKFNRREIQMIYRGFKETCPTGILTRNDFRHQFSCLFPAAGNAKLADRRNYADLVFDTFDRDKNDHINFEEFVQGLSVISRGNLQEKLEWVFSLYDVKNKGFVTKPELRGIVASMYGMMGHYTLPPYDEATIAIHSDVVFDKMDLNEDGRITQQEFVNVCQQDPHIMESLTLFDTVLI